MTLFNRKHLLCFLVTYAITQGQCHAFFLSLALIFGTALWGSPPVLVPLVEQNVGNLLHWFFKMQFIFQTILLCTEGVHFLSPTGSQGRCLLTMTSFLCQRNQISTVEVTNQKTLVQVIVVTFICNGSERRRQTMSTETLD